MIQYIDNVFQFTTPTKKNQNNSNNVESLSLQVDGPITGKAYIRRGLQPENFFPLQVDGPITGEANKWGGGGGLISGILKV